MRTGDSAMLAARRSIGILYRPGRKCCSEQRPAVAAEARASQTGGFSLRAHEGGDFQLAQLRDMRARRVRAARPIDSSCIAFAAFPPRPFVLFSNSDSPSAALGTEVGIWTSRQTCAFSLTCV